MPLFLDWWMIQNTYIAKKKEEEASHPLHEQLCRKFKIM